MTAAITDLAMKVAHRGTKTSLVTPGKALADTSIVLSNPAGWPTDTAITFSMYIEDPSTHQEQTGTYTIWKGVVNGSIVQNLVLLYGTDQVYPTGSIAIMHISADWANSLVQAFLASHNQDGTLKTSAVQSALNTSSTSSPDWTVLATVPQLNSSNGQREYVLKFPSVDYTDRLQVGTKLKVPRTSTPPTKSMGFTSSLSQYASKSSPTGISPTTQYSIESWIYPNSYTGANAGIIGRSDGTNGPILSLNGSGQLVLTASSATYQTSAQSVPLKRWVHVAGVFSSGTMSLYIDGVLVPSTKTGTGTSTTAAGNLQVGAYNGGSFFDGYIAEARIWSVAQTQTQILNNMNISLVGTETNLIALFQGNGNFNDKTSNGNNLTASGGANPNNSSVPQNAAEYCIATKVIKSGSDTLVTVFMPTGTGLPNETLGITSFSSSASPFGFPRSRQRWSVIFMARTQVQIATGSVNTYYNIGGYFLNVPIGEWLVSWNGRNLTTASTNVAFLGAFAALSATAGGNPIDPQFISQGGSFNAAVAENDSTIGASGPLTNATQSPVYLNAAVPTGGTNFVYWQGMTTPTVIYAECAYV